MRLVISTASRFKNYGLPMADLVQEGVVGLMQAAARFEPERDVRFSTYAAWWIRSAMQDFILRNWSVVRTGTTAAQKSLFFNLRRLRAKIDDGRYGSLDDAGKAYIAQELSVEVSEVESMEMRLMGGDQSLNATVSPDRRGCLAGFPDRRAAQPEENVTLTHDSRQRSRWLAASLAELSDREQTIIRERRLREDGRTLEELGVQLGISKERVRQIEHRALQKLKVRPGAPGQRPDRAGSVHRGPRLSRPPFPSTAAGDCGMRPLMTEENRVDVLIVGGGHAGFVAGRGAGAGRRLVVPGRTAGARLDRRWHF